MFSEDGAHEDEGDDDAEEDGVADGVAGEGHAAQEQECAEQGAGHCDEAADDGGGVLGVAQEGVEVFTGDEVEE